MPYTGANYENAVIEVLRDTLGYTYIYSPDASRDYSNPLYMNELLSALQLVNPKLPEGMEDAITIVIGQCEMWADN